MKTSLKQILTLTLAVAFAFTLTHCSDNNGGGSDNVGGVDCDELVKSGGHCDPSFTGSPGMDDTTIRDTAWYKELGQCRGHVIDAHTRKGIPGASVEFFTGYVVSSPEPSMVGVTKIKEEPPVDKKAPPVKKAVPFTDPFADPVKPKDSPPLDPTKGFPIPTKTTPDKKMVVGTKTSNDDASTFMDEAGLFAQKDLPSESNIKYIVTAPGYAVEQGYCDTPSPATETIHGTDLGDIELALPVDITVVVTSNGENVGNCTVHAERVDDPFQFEIAGVTDSSGSVTLKGLNSVKDHDIVIAACDNNGDGKPDAAKKVVKYDPVKSPKTINISLDDATDEQKLYVTNVNGIIATGEGLHYSSKDGSVEVDEDAIRPGASVLNFADGVPANQETMSDIFAITKTSPITIDFSWPVALVGSKYHLSYQDELSIDLKDDDDGDYNKVKYVNLTCSLSASNTRISCQPETELKINESYKIYGKVKINIPGKTEDDIKEENFDLSDLNENGGTDFWYVTDDSESNISVIAKNEKPITLDNYDGIGDEDDGADAVVNTVRMEFPEIVYGTWQVKEYMVHNEDDDAVVLAAAGCKGKLLEGMGQIVREENVSGCNDDDCDDSAKIYYRVPIDCVQTKSGGEVTVSIDATDVQGNNMSGEYKLNVR